MALRWSKLAQMLAGGASVNLPTPYSDTARYGIISGFTPGNEATIAARGRLFELGSYYLALTTPDRLWLNVVNSRAAPRQGWYRAYEADVGAPTAARSVLSTGVDPVGQKYEVDQRPYTRALMVVRTPVSVSSTAYDDATAIPVTLPAGESWYVLRMDGTVGAPVTQIQLRNSEGAILIRGSQVGLP